MDINKRKIIWTDSDDDKFWKEMWDMADMVAFEETKTYHKNKKILDNLKVIIRGGKNV